MGDQRAITIGISGCSSSGKTTLARLLRDIFPNTFILHEDDFYRPEEELPIKNGLVDWDCPEAISVPDMERALSHIRSTGTFPVSILASPTLSSRRDHGRPLHPRLLPDEVPSPLPDHHHHHSLTTTTPQPTVDSKEDLNTTGTLPIPPSAVDAAKARVDAWLQPSAPGSRIFSDDAASPPPRICLVDGFLLYSPPAFSPIMSALDIKLFLLVSRARATQRREARDGYVTLEGFWKDPPGYVDAIVWPNYAAAHAWLFEDGDAEAGRVDVGALEREGIRAQVGKGLDVDFGETLEWAVGVVMEELERAVLRQEKP